eukprot:scaffold11499_cov80-Skeletonema_menzelii.AAC.1
MKSTTLHSKNTQDPNLYAFQTDSIEGWLQSETHPSINVTITSAYSTVLKRHIAVLISIMFARTAKHYAAHFCTLLAGIGYKDYDELKAKFPGNISDFSLAELEGWAQAIRTTFKIGTDIDLEIEQTYKCCRVHFLRSVARVKKSFRLVPRHKLDKFQHLISILLSPDRTNEDRFYKTVEEIRNNFCLLKDWINWYVTNNIERCFFPAVDNGGIKGFGKDTNAQEGTGRWYKHGYRPGKKIDLPECFKYLCSKAKLIQQDTNAEKEGRLTA